MPSRARKALIGAAAGASLLAVTWIVTFHVTLAERVDRSVLRGFAGLQRGRLDVIARFVAGLCDPDPYVFLAAIPVAIALLRRRPRVAVTVGLIMLGANVSTEVLKPLLVAQRLPAIKELPAAVASWPSGHATAVMTLALCVVIAAPARLRPAAGAAMAAFAIAVCYSFMELGWHYPSDVLGGFLMAVTWTLLGAGALWWMEERRPVRRRELSPTGRPQFSVGEALAPTAALILAALFLAGVVALARPHAVIVYASAHSLFIVGAAAIALLVLTLATAATLVLRRS
jgi:membrane-associated phospholipid phosphatase